jgi:hypothetical protein
MAARAALIEGYSMCATGAVAAQLALVVCVLGDATHTTNASCAATAYELQRDATQQLALDAEKVFRGPASPVRRVRRSRFWNGIGRAYGLAAEWDELAGHSAAPGPTVRASTRRSPISA